MRVLAWALWLLIMGVASRLISSSLLSFRICDNWLIGRIAAPPRCTTLPRNSYRRWN